MGTVDYLIHKFLDERAVFFHIPYIHMLGKLLALFVDLFHQSVKLFLQFRLFDLTG